MKQAFIVFLLDAGLIWIIALLLCIYILGKFALKAYTVFKVCQNPKLSNEKVAALTKMISKNPFQFKI